jgi:hypothetical protein
LPIIHLHFPVDLFFSGGTHLNLCKSWILTVIAVRVVLDPLPIEIRDLLLVLDTPLKKKKVLWLNIFYFYFYFEGLGFANSPSALSC